MEKRPTSMTVIGWLLIVLGVFGIYSVVTMGSNPIVLKMLEQTHVSLLFEQVIGTINVIVSIVSGYGILKGQPWSRVLYVGWGIVSLGIGLYTSPIKGFVVFGLIILVVIGAFLFTNTANDWFSARGLMLKRERS